MKKRNFLIIFILISVISNWSYSEVIEKIVAKVNDEVILQLEVEEMIEFMKMQGIAEEISESELKEKVVNTMIDNLIIVIAAEKEEIAVADEEINYFLESQIDEMKSKFPTEEDFLDEIKRQKMTLAELKSMYREQIKNKLLSERLIEKKIKSRIFIKTEEVEKFYTEHREEFLQREDQVQFISLSVPFADYESALRKIESIRNDIVNNGKSFTKLAKKYSDDPTGKDGGALGLKNKGFLNRDQREAVEDLKEGDISEVVEIRGKFYIFKVNKIEEDKIDISQIVTEPKSSKSSKRKAFNNIAGIKNALGSGEDILSQKGPYIKVEQGQLMNLDEMNEKIRENIKDLPENGISEIVELENGYYIFKVEKVLGKEFKQLSEVYTEISNYLYDRKLHEHLNEYIEEFKQNVYIKIYNF